MKAVILAGGLGTRLSEETSLKPKPMVEIGGFPILWHIMKIYSFHDINEFVICCGYKGFLIKEFFFNYFLHTSDLNVDLEENKVTILRKGLEKWKVTLVDTGLNTLTGGRIKRISKHIGNETFCMTYGDGLSDINIGSLINFHKSHNKLATITAIKPQGRFGSLSFKDNLSVNYFQEKPKGKEGWINGGFFVLEPEIFKYIDNDNSVWENETLTKLSAEENLMAYKHEGFWQPMDTLRDKLLLEDLWEKGEHPWKIWN
tara:strand:- start:1100 stop:1873 length:774 start_codon:yes stop_codon:yes gene_type:complete